MVGMACGVIGNANVFSLWFEDVKTCIDVIGFAKVISIGSVVIRDHWYGRGRIVVPDLRLQLEVDMARW